MLKHGFALESDVPYDTNSINGQCLSGSNLFVPGTSNNVMIVFVG
jgi:hypothetical protein